MNSAAPAHHMSLAWLPRLAWFAVQLLLAAVAMMSFFTWAPWIAAQPVSEASTEILAVLPPDCPAFTIGHGVASCFPLGTRQDNPGGFALAVAATFVCSLANLSIAGTGRGLRTERLHRWLRTRWHSINIGREGGAS